MSATHHRKLVAIVVAHFDRDYLTDSEEISLKQLLHHLPNYDKHLIIPDTLEFSLPGFENQKFSKQYFGSAMAHKDLLFSKQYYERFSDYEYILSYHFDALVFSNQLEYWCSKNYDFIGPPWIIHKDTPYYGNSNYEGKVGNGGFSLKKVSSFIKLLSSNIQSMNLNEYWRTNIQRRNPFKSLANLPKLKGYLDNSHNNVNWEIYNWNKNDDLFIADRAKHYYPGFRLAPFDEALKFGFECAPQHCYEQNGNKLPFGCHAWEKYDRAFWEPYLIK